MAIVSTGPVGTQTFPASGQALDTTGTIGAAALDQLDITSAVGWTVGVGIGIAGAGPGGAAWRTTVKNVAGNVLTLELAALQPVLNARVTSDDGAAIQAAIDFLGPDGGVVSIPADTFVIGTPRLTTPTIPYGQPGFQTNVPIFIHSGVTLRGAGRGQTRLRLCDDANQIAVARISLGSDMRDLPSASMLVNYSNPWWHHSQSYDPKAPVMDAPDHDIVIEDLAVDGNNFNQRAIFIPGNRTRSAVPDAATGFLAAPTTAGQPPGAGQQPLVAATPYYNVAMTYADAQGNETGSYPPYQQVTLGVGQDAIQVEMPLPPPGAVAQFVYIQDPALAPFDTASWPYTGVMSASRIWDRQQVSVFTPGLALPYTIVGYTPGVGSAPIYPPGLGLIGQTNATVSSAIALDNCSNVVCRRVEVRDVVVDGITVAISDIPNHVGPPLLGQHSVIDAAFEDIEISGCGRNGFAITGQCRRIRFIAMDVHDNSGNGGFDFEASPGEVLPASEILLQDCRFRNHRSGAGGTLHPFEDSPMRITFIGCEFDANGGHLQVGGSGVTDISLVGCIFSNAITYAVSAWAPGTGLITGCRFILNGKPKFPTPNYIPGSGPPGISQIFLGGASLPGPYPGPWVVSGNLFVCEPIPGLLYPYAIYLLPISRGHVIVNNAFDVIQTDPSRPVDPFKDAPGIVLESGHPEDYLIHSNTGTFVVENFATTGPVTERARLWVDGASGGRPAPVQFARLDSAAYDVVIPVPPPLGPGP